MLSGMHTAMGRHNQSQHRRRPPGIRVSVVDGGAGFDATNLLRSPRADEGGWGLFLVGEMSDHWGIDRDPHSVWFEIHRD